MDAGEEGRRMPLRRGSAAPVVAPLRAGPGQMDGTDPKSDRLPLSGHPGAAIIGRAYGSIMQRAFSPMRGAQGVAVPLDPAPGPGQVFSALVPDPLVPNPATERLDGRQEHRADNHDQGLVPKSGRQEEGGDQDHHDDSDTHDDEAHGPGRSHGGSDRHRVAEARGEVPTDPSLGHQPLQRSLSSGLQCNVQGCPQGKHRFTSQRKAQEFIAHLNELKEAGILDDDEFGRCCLLQRGNGLDAKQCPTCLEWLGTPHYLRLHKLQCRSSSRVPPRAPIAAALTPASARMGGGGAGAAMSPASMQPRVAAKAVTTGGGHASRSPLTEKAPAPSLPPSDPRGRGRAERAGADQNVLPPNRVPCPSGSGPRSDLVVDEIAERAHALQSAGERAAHVVASVLLFEPALVEGFEMCDDPEEALEPHSVAALQRPTERAEGELGMQQQVGEDADGHAVQADILQSHQEEGEPENGIDPGPAEEGQNQNPAPDSPPTSDGEDSDEEDGNIPDGVEADGSDGGPVKYKYEPVERVAKRVKSKLRRKVIRLDHFPPWMKLQSEVQTMIQLALEDILDSSDPETFFQGWQAFFDLPDRAFTLANRGGELSGNFRRNSQAVGKSARDWIKQRAAGQLGTMPDESDGDDTQLDPSAGATRELYDQDASRIRAMKKMLKRGKVSRAFAKLTSDSIPPVSEATFEKLQPLYPPGDLTRNPQKPEGAAPLVVGDHEHVARVIKSLSGKAAGPSGWAPDLFLIMEDNQQLLSLYGQCLAMLVNKPEWRTPDLAQLITGARLLAVPKPGGDDVRPITVSEATFSHVSLLAFRQIDEEWLKELFAELGRVIQFGVGVPAGVEKAFKTMETALLCAHEAGRSGREIDWASLLVDAKAAYQHMSRDEMLGAIYAHPELEPIWGVAELAYDWANPRYVTMADGTVRIIMQADGTAQGSIISPLSWCVTQLSLLKRMAKAGCRGRERHIVAAVQDDANFAGSHGSMQKVWDVAKVGYPELGLELNLAKTVCVVPDLDRVHPDALSLWQDEGVEVVASAKLLGGCLSTADETLLEFLAERIDPERANGFSDALRRLGHPEMDPQSAKLVATIGVQHALDYYLRLFPPSVVEPLLCKVNVALLTVMTAKLGLAEISPEQHLPEWESRMPLVVVQLQLPRHHAGLGLRPLQVVSVAAYLASMAACAEEILGIAETLHSQVTRVHPELGDGGPDDPNAWLPERYRREYAFCRSRLLSLAPVLEDLTFASRDDPEGADQLKCLPTNLHQFLQTFQENPALKVKFQARMLEPVWAHGRARLTDALAHGPDPRLAAADVARLDAWSKPTAGRALSVIPTSAMTTFTPDEYVQIVREMCGLMPAAYFYKIEGPIKCREGDGVDLKSCPNHSGRLCASTRRGPTTVTHDGIGEVLCTIAARNLVPTSWTPYVPTGKATDVGFSFVDEFVHTDITVRTVDAPSNGPTVASRGADGVMLKADESKNSRYAHLVNREGVRFVALTFLNSGAHGKPVGQLLKRICDTGEALGAARPVDIKTARDWLAVALQRGRARAAIQATARMRAVGPLYKAAMVARRRNRARRLVKGGRGGGDDG